MDRQYGYLCQLGYGSRLTGKENPKIMAQVRLEIGCCQ